MKPFLIIALVFSATFAGATACPTGYTNVMDLQIPARGGMAADQTGFIVYFAGNAILAQIASGGRSQTTGGLDIVPCDAASSGNLINFELINYVGTTGVAEFYMSQTISKTVTKHVYFQVGKAADTDHSNAAGVCSAASLVSMLHFGSASTLSIVDSCGGGTATNHGVAASTGQIGGAGNFNGTSQYMDFSGTALNLTSAVAMSAWVKTTGSAGPLVFGAYQNGGSFAGYGFGIGELAANNNPCYWSQAHAAWVCATSGISSGVWTHIATAEAGTTANFYINGGGAGGFTTNQPSSYTGAKAIGAIAGGGSNFWKDQIDEFRLYNVAPSADWFAADYANQNTPASFYTLVFVTINTTTLPGAAVGVAYSETLSASGGTGPYTWGIFGGGTLASQGAACAGLSLSSGGLITGTPTTTGTCSFTVQATDANSVSSTQALSIAVAANNVLGFVNPVLNAASVSPYSADIHTCTLTNGTQSSVTTGDPIIAVYHLDSGTISAIADTCGTSFTLIDTETSGAFVTSSWVGAAACTGADTITWTTSGVSGAIGSCVELDKNQYTTTVNSHGGAATQAASATYQFSTVSTNNREFNFDFLHTNTGGGLIVYPVFPTRFVGNITGGNAGAGFSIGYTAGATDTRTYTLSATPSDTNNPYVTLALAPTTIRFLTASIPTGSLSSAYDYFLPVGGGTGTYTWSITSGTLFTGLSLNGATGEISGTPTAGGTHAITFHVTDGTNTADLGPINLVVNSSQSTSAYINGCGTASTFSCTLASVAVGDVIVVEQYIGYHGGYMGLNPPFDGLGNSYKFIDACLNAAPQTSSEADGIAYYLATSTGSGSDLITPTPNNTPSHAYAIVAQFRNVQAFIDKEVCTSGVSASTATITSSNLSVVTANSMVLDGAVFQTAGGTYSAVSPFTLGLHDTGAAIRDMLTEYDNATTVGTIAPQMSQVGNTGGGWEMGALSLRPTTTGTVSASGVPRHKGEVF